MCVPEQRLYGRLLRGWQPDCVSDAGDVRTGHEEPAAYPSQVSLRLQPAGLLQGHPGGLPHQERRRRGQENFYEVIKVVLWRMSLIRST